MSETGTDAQASSGDVNGEERDGFKDIGDIPDLPPLGGAFGSGMGEASQPFAELSEEPAAPTKDSPARIALKQIVVNPGQWVWHLFGMWARQHADNLREAGKKTEEDIFNTYLQDVLIDHARIYQDWQENEKIPEERYAYDFTGGFAEAIAEMMHVQAMAERKQLINQGIKQTLQRLSAAFPKGEIPPEVAELAWMGEEH